MDFKTIKDKLRELKITQDVLAQELGVSRRTVLFWFSGKKEPSQEHLLKMSQVLKDLGIILPGAEKIQPEPIPIKKLTPEEKYIQHMTKPVPRDLEKEKQYPYVKKTNDAKDAMKNRRLSSRLKK